MKFDWTKLYDDLERDQETSWRKTAKVMSLTPSVFTRISQGKPVSVENLIKLIQGRDFWRYIKRV